MSMTYENAEGWRLAAAAELDIADDDSCPNCLGGSSAEFPCVPCGNSGHIRESSVTPLPDLEGN